MTRGKRRRVEPSDPKIAALQATRTLNRDPQAVVDPLFRDNAFFDPRDGLQVRYELVRRHRLEGTSMSTAARLFGVSLPTAYQTDANFSAAGFAGLLPKRRGPKHGHKLTPQTLTHLERQLRERPDWGIGELLSDLQQTFGLTIHRRSLERVLRGKKKLPHS